MRILSALLKEEDKRAGQDREDKRAELWRKVEAQQAAMETMKDLVGGLPRIHVEFSTNEFYIHVLVFCVYITKKSCFWLPCR